MADEKGSEKKGPKVGEVAMEAIKAGKTNEEALAAVQKAIPGSKTSLASINWYRNNMRKTDKSIPTSRELRKKAKAAEKDPLD